MKAMSHILFSLNSTFYFLRAEAPEQSDFSSFDTADITGLNCSRSKTHSQSVRGLTFVICTDVWYCPTKNVLGNF